MKTPWEILLARHRKIEPKLEEMWNHIAPRPVTTESPPGGVVHLLWHELVWPCRWIWGGLACAWALIIVLNALSYEPVVTQVADRTEAPSREEVRALIEQRQMLAQLIGPVPKPVDARKRSTPGPQSKRLPESAAV